MKSGIVRPRNNKTTTSSATNNSSSSSSSASTSTATPAGGKQSSGNSSSGIPKLSILGGARPKAIKTTTVKSAAASTLSSASTVSVSSKRLAVTTERHTKREIRTGDSSVSTRNPGKRKLPVGVRPKVSWSSGASSKREKSDFDCGIAPVRRAQSSNSKRIGFVPIGKKPTGVTMHRTPIPPVSTMATSSGCLDEDKSTSVLNRLEREKNELEHRVSELVHNAEAKKAQVVTLRGEIGRLKEQHKSRSETVLLENESLHMENQLLRDRLEELGIAFDGQATGRALSDTEKEILLLSESYKRIKCNSAPPSIAGNMNGNRGSPFCRNGSGDDVESDGEALSGGAYLANTDVRGSIEWDNKSSSSVSEVSVACLQDRILQMEETHYSTSEELQATLQELSDLQDQLTELQSENGRLVEEKSMFLESLCAKVQQLEECRSQLDAVRRQLVDQHPETSDVGSSDVRSIEFEHLRSLLDVERSKVAELTVASMCRVGDPSLVVSSNAAASAELEVARKERELFEARIVALQEQLNVGHCETARLREQMAIQQEESEVVKRNAEELEFRLDQALAARDELNARARELERTCRSYVEERRELRKDLDDMERRVAEESSRAESMRRRLDDASARHARDQDEWRQFQADLLMAVRVANDFKIEAQRDGERLAAETRGLLDRVQLLEAENERLAKTLKATTSPTFQRSSSTSSYDMRQSVKSLIETIENASKSGVLDLPPMPSSVPCSPTSEKPRPPPILRHAESEFYVKPPSMRPVSADVSSTFQKSQSTNAVRPSVRSSRQWNSYAEGTSTSPINVNSSTSKEKISPTSKLQVQAGSSVIVQTDEGDLSPMQTGVKPAAVVSPTPVSILANKSADVVKRPSFGESSNDKKDPLTVLAKGGGSRRNALLKWCQNRTIGYKGIDITNFSSSWNDGLAFCALVHGYLSDVVPYDTLDSKDKRRNFTIAFQAAESVGIPTILNINDMISMERPDWQMVMTYVTSIYKHFET